MKSYNACYLSLYEGLSVASMNTEGHDVDLIRMNPTSWIGLIQQLNKQILLPNEDVWIWIRLVVNGEARVAKVVADKDIPECTAYLCSLNVLEETKFMEITLSS